MNEKLKNYAPMGRSNITYCQASCDLDLSGANHLWILKNVMLLSNLKCWTLKVNDAQDVSNSNFKLYEFTFLTHSMPHDMANVWKDFPSFLSNQIRFFTHIVFSLLEGKSFLYQVNVAQKSYSN
jgi:hypothetical protein